MSRIVTFTANNWESIHNYSASVTPLGDNSYIPLSPVDVPIFLESDIIAVYVSTNVPNGKSWRYGGNIEQRFVSGLTVGGQSDASGEPKSVWINKITTIFFPKISASYSLKYYPPRWFKNVALTIWQYTGPDDVQTDITQAEEFSNINFKLDQINGKLPFYFQQLL